MLGITECVVTVAITKQNTFTCFIFPTRHLGTLPITNYSYEEHTERNMSQNKLQARSLLSMICLEHFFFSSKDIDAKGSKLDIYQFLH